MADRLVLQNRFEELLGSTNVYFQPPASVRMHYPAIRYSLDGITTLSANDSKYRLNKAYTVTYIHSNPDDPITDSIAALPMCRFDRRYVSDNLYHDVYTLYN